MTLYLSMTASILKAHWERFRAHIDLDLSTAQKLIFPWTNSKIRSLELLSEGCANTNYKLIFEDATSPVVLRIYLPDRGALPVEQAIFNLVQNRVPVPKFLYSNDSCELIPYPYALTEWMEGTLMRQILLQGDEKDVKECAFAAGIFLNVLRNISFKEGGFFRKDLSIQPFKEEEKYLPFALNLLDQKEVKESLSPSLINTLHDLILNKTEFLPSTQKANLTHGDYDPANMLVSQVNGKWIITAILDWEFSFAGSYFFDIGTMLRYAHKLPKIYEESFVEGVTSFGSPLPSHWKITTKLVDLLSLLQLLYQNPFDKRPKMNRDVVELIENTISLL